MEAMAAKHSNPEEENENQRELSTNGECNIILLGVLVVVVVVAPL